MQQRLVNYLIVLVGILGVVSIAVGFGVWYNQFKPYIDINNLEQLQTNDIEKLFNHNNGYFIESLKPFNEYSLAGYIVPIVLLMLSAGIIVGYYFANKKIKAKLEYPISPKFLKHNMFTTMYLASGFALAAFMLSYIGIGVDFASSDTVANAIAPSSFNAYKTDQVFIAYHTNLVAAFNAKKNMYIALFVVVILFATIVVGFMNFYSLKISLEQSTKASIAKLEQEKDDPRSEYYLNNLNEIMNQYDHFVITQKQSLSSYLFDNITAKEDELIEADQKKFVDLTIEEKLAYRNKATELVLATHQTNTKEQEEFNRKIEQKEDDKNKPFSSVSSGSF
ncbi:hypothetical protein [Ureaplasma diversum]|uniref:Transmembrane protein n=1 Tax=Ureaplasma diversum NCTC 246 TaxID=1188241 RepID=A0A084F1K8_9BACT|nr:hypothetical protein [Ureaplasma diversum]KEZ24100.1 Hypothetical protein, predicted transmembrane protein [Ureaplasma diversum NCTC 246]